MDLFGGKLSILDDFSSTFSKFKAGISSASNSFSEFSSALKDAQRLQEEATRNMRSNVMTLAAEYRKQGMSASEAMIKAWQETERISKASFTTGNKWADAFVSIKEAGSGAFDGINKSVEKFSNSTMGTIAKLTAGFASFEGIKMTIGNAFDTASTYQNLRINLDNLYKSSAKGASEFTMATNFAANSIWQEREVVRSLAMLKGYGLDDSKASLSEMSDLGSFEKSMGRGDISTATQAYSEMLEGRWYMTEMELGIKRQDVEKYAKQHNMKAFDNSKGAITNKEALATAFKAYIDERGLTGLTDKMKDTFTGRLSTLKDNIGKSLADIIGVANDGSVKANSLFQRFCDGMKNFTTRIQQFSETDKFQKFSDEISKLGSALSYGFSYLLDHPELITDILKFGAAIWTLGKVSSIISSIGAIYGGFTTILGAAFPLIAAVFGEGGIFAAFGAAILPFVSPLAAIVEGFLLLSSALSPDGLLNRGIGTLLGWIFGEDVKKGWQDDTNDLSNFLSESKQGWGMILSGSTGAATNNALANSGISAAAYGSYQYPTISNTLANGGYTTNTANNTSYSPSINMNIGKVEHTADVDDIMTTITQRLDKYYQTRNNVN